MQPLRRLFLAVPLLLPSPSARAFQIPAAANRPLLPREVSSSRSVSTSVPRLVDSAAATATAVRLARIGGPDPPEDEDRKSGGEGGKEEEYRRKLAEADAAVAAAEEARRRLLKRKGQSDDGDGGVGSPSLRPPPVALRSDLSYSDAGTLTLTVPPRGIGADSVVSGAFSIAWFSGVAPATFASGGAFPFLFMLPFWLAGGVVAKTAIVDPFVSSILTVGRYAWSLKSTYAGVTVGKKEGATDDLGGAEAALVAVVNGVPQWELRLFGRKGDAGLGTGLLSEAEVRYLAGEINRHLGRLREMPVDVGV